jgi:hypothetical protein
MQATSSLTNVPTASTQSIAKTPSAVHDHTVSKVTINRPAVITQNAFFITG